MTKLITYRYSITSIIAYLKHIIDLVSNKRIVSTITDSESNFYVRSLEKDPLLPSPTGMIDYEPKVKGMYSWSAIRFEATDKRGKQAMYNRSLQKAIQNLVNLGNKIGYPDLIGEVICPMYNRMQKTGKIDLNESGIICFSYERKNKLIITTLFNQQRNLVFDKNYSVFVSSVRKSFISQLRGRIDKMKDHALEEGMMVLINISDEPMDEVKKAYQLATDQERENMLYGTVKEVYEETEKALVSFSMMGSISEDVFEIKNLMPVMSI